MKILVTGAKGMVGTAFVNNLKNLRDGKNEPTLIFKFKLKRYLNMTLRPLQRSWITTARRLISYSIL